MSTHFLPKKRKSVYHRAVIPRNLQPYFQGRSEIWRSLKTSDKDEAKARSAAWDSRIQQLFLALRKHGERMTNAQREALVARWLESELDYAEECRALMAGPISENYWESQLDGLSIMEEQAHEALVTCNYPKVQREADELLNAAGLPALDHAGADFGRLCRRLLQAKIEYTRIETDRWNGVYAPAVRVHEGSGRSSTHNSAMKSTGPLFSVVVDKFIAETMSPKSRSLKPLRAELLRFLDTIKGDRPIDAVSKDDARGYKDQLLTVRKLSLMTVGKHIMSLQAIFKFALSQGYLPEGKSNPFTGLAPSKKIIRKTKLTIRDFTAAELLTVFGSKDFLVQRTECPSRYWVCLMALFMGLRREEAAQAAVANIHQSEGIYYLQTAVDEALQQNLKNEGSKRRVVIPAALLSLGLLEYVEQRKQAGHVRLFPDLNKGGNGYGDAIGKWFGRHVTSVGLLDPALVFHSTRHTFITNLYAAKCPRETVQLLAGHSDGTVHEGYINKDALPLALLQEGIERLQYPELVAVLTKGA